MEEFNTLKMEKLVEMIHPEDREKVFNFYKSWAGRYVSWYPAS